MSAIRYTSSGPRYSMPSFVTAAVLGAARLCQPSSVGLQSIRCRGSFSSMRFTNKSYGAESCAQTISWSSASPDDAFRASFTTVLEHRFKQKRSHFHILVLENDL